MKRTIEMIQKVNKLASYATYRQLYNDGKSDSYVVIAKFIEHIIISNRMIRFDVGEISELLNKNFSFSIPNYVLQSAIGKISFVTKEERKYVVKSKEFLEQNSAITQNLENANTSSQALTQKLLQYVKDNNYLSVDKDELIREFSAFLLDEYSNGEYSSIFSKFVIENETDEIFLKNINQIKEGAILFSGLNYTSDISKTTWNNNVFLYVGTEILFHLAGYNGLIFKELASEMFNLIKEMNQKSQRRIITIRYFKEVQEEIDNFFSTAEAIVRGQKIADIGNVAMDTIVEGCSSAADVLKKHSEFNNLLKRHSISVAQNEDYYSKKYHSFNIENQETIDKYKLSTENKENYLKYLNYVNILRGRDKVDLVNSNLRDSKHIVVTEIRKILQIAKELIAIDGRENRVPLAVNMYIVTNRLWFDLNKGFGSKQLPTRFSVLDKSRIILSNLLTQKVSQQYDRVIKSYRSGELSEDDLNENILLLRQEIKKPEEIHRELLNDIDKVTTTNSLDLYKSQNDTLLKRVEELEKEKRHKELEKDKEIEARLVFEKEIKDKEIKINKIIKEKEEEREKRLNDLLLRKEKADSKIDSKIKQFRVLIGIILTVLFSSGVCVYIKYNYDVLAFVFGIIPGFTGIVLIIFGKKIEFLDVVDKLLLNVKQRYEKILYDEYNINIEELEKLQSKE